MTKKEDKKHSDKEINIRNLFFDENGKFKPVNLREYFLSICDVIYCPEIGFLIWNDQYWKVINQNYLGHLLDGILQEETSNYRIQEVIGLIQKKMNTDVHSINQNKNRLVLKNGTLDISDWESPIFYDNEYFKEDYSIIQLNVKYDDNAKAITFEKYLKTTFENDEERMALVCEMLGYCLQPKCNLEKAFILYGTGGNGKSKLLNIIDYIWTNDNIAEVSMADLDKPFVRSSIYGKLINKSSELDSRVKDTSYFKKLVSGEFVDAQFKFKDVFKFKNMAKMVFSMNSLPSIKDKSDGLYRRIIMIPFLKKFDGEEKDINLDAKLQAEADGIFQLALKGLRNLAINKEFTYSQKAEDLLNQYKEENDPTKQFCNDTVVEKENAFVSCADLYESYKEWCAKYGFKPLNNANFGKEIIRLYGSIKERKRINTQREYVYIGIDLIAVPSVPSLSLVK